MDILIDYDNVEPHMRREGLVQLSARIVNAIAERKMQFPVRCRIRLYGGWYENSNLTRQAQDLITEMEVNFPNRVAWRCLRGSGSCVAQLQMARSLEVDPARILYRTLRTREVSEHIKQKKEAAQQCQKQECPVQSTIEFLEKRKCLENSCYRTPADILCKVEQKLVDTMITADLIHLAKTGQHDLAVVSSDDDLWPGIQTALVYGARVIQVHTRADRETPHCYTAGLAQYKDTAL